MSSRAFQFQVNSKIAKPRVQSAPNASSSTNGRTASSAHNSLMLRNDIAPKARILHGKSTEEEVRKQQVLKYREDLSVFQQKEKEKADKKQAEKHKRYNHVNLGQRLQDHDDNNMNSLACIRELQQSRYNRSPDTLRFNQERGEMQDKREKQKKEEKLEKSSSVITGQRLSHEPFPTSLLSTSSLESQNAKPANPISNNAEQREEEFRKQMRARRERMQEQYTQNVNSDV